MSQARFCQAGRKMSQGRFCQAGRKRRMVASTLVPLSPLVASSHLLLTHQATTHQDQSASGALITTDQDQDLDHTTMLVKAKLGKNTSRTSQICTNETKITFPNWQFQTLLSVS